MRDLSEPRDDKLINATLVLFQPVQSLDLGIYVLPWEEDTTMGRHCLGWSEVGEQEFGVSGHCPVSTTPLSSPFTPCALTSALKVLSLWSAMRPATTISEPS